MKQKRKLYGMIVERLCGPDTTPGEKAELIQDGIKSLIEKMTKCEIVPDFNTIQFIVHERPDPWDPFAGRIEGKELKTMTIGVKYEADDETGD
jgi:hypothetical protein